MARILPGVAFGLGLGLALGSVNAASALPIRCFEVPFAIERSPASDDFSSVLSRRVRRTLGDCDEGTSFDLDSVLDSASVTDSLSRSTPRADLDDLGDLSHEGGKAKPAGREKEKPDRTKGRLLKEPHESSHSSREDRTSGPPSVKKKHSAETSHRTDRRSPN